MSDLADRKCIPCKKGTPALRGSEIRRLLEQIHEDWVVVDEHHLERSFEFDDFVQALAFTNRVGELAEEQAHHPDILLTWGRVRVTVWTHTVDGLSENDFIFAAKADALSKA